MFILNYTHTREFYWGGGLRCHACWRESSSNHSEGTTHTQISEEGGWVTVNDRIAGDSDENWRLRLAAGVQRYGCWVYFLGLLYVLPFSPDGESGQNDWVKRVLGNEWSHTQSVQSRLYKYASTNASALTYIVMSSCHCRHHGPLNVKSIMIPLYICHFMV